MVPLLQMNTEKVCKPYVMCYDKEKESSKIKICMEDFTMKVGLAGTGWRAQMYVRVMEALGADYEISAVYVHSESSKEREEKNFPGKVYTDYDAFLKPNRTASSLC